jgi:hypothetical protein
MAKSFSEETENNIEELDSNNYTSIFNEIDDTTERITTSGKKETNTEYDESERDDERFSFKYGTSLEDLYKQKEENENKKYTSIFEDIKEDTKSIDNEETKTDEELLEEDTLEEEPESDEDINYTKEITNGILQGAKHTIYNISNQGSLAKTSASLLWEYSQPKTFFGDPTINDIHITQPFQPEGINSEAGSISETLGRTIMDMVYQMTLATTGSVIGGVIGGIGGGLVGSPTGPGAAGTAALGTGIGAAKGGFIGSTVGAGMLANAMVNESFHENYDRYIQEGKSDAEATQRAIEDAGMSGYLEFGTDVTTAGIAKLFKVGISSSKLANAALKLFKSGALKKTEAGYEITKEGTSLLTRLAKNILKDAEKVSGSKLGTFGKQALKGAAIEGVVEEGGEAVWTTGRHRKEGQTWGEAIAENKKEIGKNILIGSAVGGVVTGGALAVGGGVSKLMDYGSDKLEQKKLDKIAQQKEYEEATQNVLIEQRKEEGNPNPENLPAVVTQSSNNLPAIIDQSNNIKKSYSENVQKNDTVFVVDENGDTVLTTQSELTKNKPVTNTDDSVDSELIIDNNENDNTTETDETDEEETFNQSVDNTDKLAKTRKDLSESNDLGNKEEENSIEGSVSDDGYVSSQDHPLDSTGVSKKDESPSTPQTDKLFMVKQNHQTKKALKDLNINKDQEELKPLPTIDKSDRDVKNNHVSKYHKYYAVKNFVEGIGIRIADRANEVFNLYVKGELSNKEKRMQGMSKRVMEYVTPAKNNVIRISNSRDYNSIIHGTVHHLVHQMKLLKEDLQKNADIITKEYKKLERFNPNYKLDEAAYKKNGADLIEEYFSNLTAAYATDEAPINRAIVDIIYRGLDQVGKEDRKNFDIMRQVFKDYNTLRSTDKGTLQLIENEMTSARLLYKGKFDTSDLNETQLKTRKRFINASKKIPRFIKKFGFDEAYELEKAAKRTGDLTTIKRANQLLVSTNRIAEAYIKGTGAYFHKGTLRKLEHNRAIKNLTKIAKEAESLGEDGLTKLESLLYAKQTIGESTGNQRKGENLITLANDLGYDKWLDARKDLKLLSTIFKKNLYQNKPITQKDLEEGLKLQKSEQEIFLEEDNSEQESKRTDMLSVNFKDKNLQTRLNNIIKYINDKTNEQIKKENKYKALKRFSKTDPDIQAVLQSEQKERNLMQKERADYISKNYLLDKQGSVNTGMTLEEALSVYTTIQNDPRADKFNRLDEDVRKLLQGLENLMTSSDISSRMQIEFAKEGTGAWYIPLLRFIDVDEEKAVGLNLGGNPMQKRFGSNREVRSILSSIETSIFAVSNLVAKNRAIDKLISLKDRPIFAQYIREVPQDSREIKADMLTIVSNKINELRSRVTNAQAMGTIDQNELNKVNNYINNLENIKQQILNGEVLDEDTRVQLFVEEPPKNKNIIQRIEEDGKVHYYLVNDTIKDFLYNQRKAFLSVHNLRELLYDAVLFADKILVLGNLLPRFSYTQGDPGFQVTNIARDSADAAYKTLPNEYFRSLLYPLDVLRLFSKNMGRLAYTMTPWGWEDFNHIAATFGGAEQTQFREGEELDQYLDFKVNKKGKVVRGGRLAVVNTIIDFLGNTDLIPRVTSLKEKAKKLGVDLDTIDMTYDDYVSLNTKKKYLKRYLSDKDIENIFGKERATIWREVGDDEYIPFVPENFEKEKLNKLLSTFEKEIDSNINEDLFTELQDIYDNCTINFSKGTPLTRTLGRVFLFAHARIQGGWQTVKWAANNKRAASGVATSLLTLGALSVMLGLDDPTQTEKEGLSGMRLQFKQDMPVINYPAQSAPLWLWYTGQQIGHWIKGNLSGTESAKKILSASMAVLSDNFNPIKSPSGTVGFLMDLPTLYYTGKTSYINDEEDYHSFSYFYKNKVGANVDRLTKNMDYAFAELISSWLIDSGLSTKYSTHEITNLLRNILGNTPNAIDSLLGLKIALTDTDSHLNFFDYEDSNPIEAIKKKVMKGFVPEEKLFSADHKYIKEQINNQMTLYKRYTQQPLSSMKDLTKPEDIPEDIKKDVVKYYEKSFLAAKANNLLQKLLDQAQSCDITTPEGEKAFIRAAKLYKKTAEEVRRNIDNYEANSEEPLTRKQAKQIVTQISKEVEKALSEPNGLEKLWNSLGINRKNLRASLEWGLDTIAGTANAEELVPERTSQSNLAGYNNYYNSIVESIKSSSNGYNANDYRINPAKWNEEKIKEEAIKRTNAVYNYKIDKLHEAYNNFEQMSTNPNDYDKDFNDYIVRKITSDKDNLNIRRMSDEQIKHLVQNYYLEDVNPLGNMYRREANDIFNPRFNNGGGIGLYHFKSIDFVKEFEKNLNKYNPSLAQKVFYKDGKKLYSDKSSNGLITNEEAKKIQNNIKKEMNNKDNLLSVMDASNLTEQKRIIDKPIEYNNSTTTLRDMGYEDLTNKERVMLLSCINNRGDSPHVLIDYMTKLKDLKNTYENEDTIIDKFYDYHINKKPANVRSSFEQERDEVKNSNGTFLIHDIEREDEQ